jgi:hypothetical protein
MHREGAIGCPASGRRRPHEGRSALAPHRPETTTGEGPRYDVRTCARAEASDRVVAIAVNFIAASQGEDGWRGGWVRKCRNVRGDEGSAACGCGFVKCCEGLPDLLPQSTFPQGCLSLVRTAHP